MELENAFIYSPLDQLSVICYNKQNNWESCVSYIQQGFNIRNERKLVLEKCHNVSLLGLDVTRYMAGCSYPFFDGN